MQVQAKIQQQAILIDDDQMVAEKPSSITYHYIPAPGKSSFDTQLRLCKEKQVNEDEDPEATILRRLVKFFQYNKKIEPGNEYFTSRKEPFTEGELIQNEIIIFGCDFKKLKLVKKEYMTTQSLIINPSNFKLIYSDRGTAWKAIEANAKDPTSLAGKRQSEQDPLPRCWIEMKPYSFHNRLIKVFVRYATEDERNIEPMKEEWAYTYNKCKEIYNAQEDERKEKELLEGERKRERLEFQQQRNSKRLYDKFNEENQDAWQRGANFNPGAQKDEKKRQNSHSRSRSKHKNKPRQEKMVNENLDDSKSNYSFVMNKSLAEINNAISGIQLEDASKDKKSEINLSFEMRPEGSEYQWNGKKGENSTKYNWSYSEYMKKAELDQEISKRHKEGKVPVITIDD